MSDFVKMAFEALKVGGYLATGGFCFHLLSGGKLPFQTMGNVSLGTLPTPTNEYNAMASNSKDKKDKKGKVDTDPAANDTAKPNQDAQAKNNADDAAKNTAKPAQDAHGNFNKNENTESEIRRQLSRASICGGAVGALTPECRAKMEEIEKKRQTSEEEK